MFRPCTHFGAKSIALTVYVDTYSAVTVLYQHLHSTRHGEINNSNDGIRASYETRLFETIVKIIHHPAFCPEIPRSRVPVKGHEQLPQKITTIRAVTGEVVYGVENAVQSLS